MYVAIILARISSNSLFVNDLIFIETGFTRIVENE